VEKEGRRNMETLTIELPAMYGDHHVIEVRRLLLETPGVEDVYASSGFHVVEVTYDPTKLTQENIRVRLEEAGYQGELPVPVEADAASYLEKGDRSFFRHSTVYENMRQAVSFAQTVSYYGRPLWPCPGMGPIQAKSLEEE
jgi:copper chaperone CopZ